MTGWYVQSSAIVQIMPSFAPMQFTTAFTFLLIAVGILCYPKYPKLGQLSALLILTSSALSFYGYLIEKPIWFDDFFVKPFTVTETAYPGRMAVNTAFAFSLAGASLLFSFLKLNKFSSLGGYLGLLVFGLGLTALIAYFLDLEYIYKWGKLTGMALHTCSCFILLGLALIFLNLRVLSQKALSNRRDLYLFGFTLTMQIIFMLVDVVIPNGIAVGVIQIVGIGMMTLTGRKEFLLVSLIAALTNIYLGYVYSETIVSSWIVYADRALSVLVAIIVYFLCLIILKKEDAVRQQNKNLDKKVSERTKELSAKNQDLEQFAFILTHDLMEPLRTISSYSELVKDTNRDNLDELGKRSVDYMNFSAKRMEVLIRGMLEYSRLGKTLQLEFTQIDKLVRKILVEMNPEIQKKEARVNLIKLPFIECYSKELEHIFRNLLSNALKFQQPNLPPEIEIGYENRPTHHLFYVKDNGIGIPTNFQNRIFKLFQRLHSEQEYEGIGIGLAQCLKITELHQGSIWVESDGINGSTFYFTLSKMLKTHVDYDQENPTN